MESELQVVWGRSADPSEISLKNAVLILHYLSSPVHLHTLVSMQMCVYSCQSIWDIQAPRVKQELVHVNVDSQPSICSAVLS